MSVLKLSEAVIIAIYSLYELSKEPGKIKSAYDLAIILNVSEGHLAKIMQKLVKAGYVESIRGPKGGFIIKSDVKKIFLLDIYELIEGKFKPNPKMYSSPVCCSKSVLEKLAENVDDIFLDMFESCTIDDLT